MAGSSLYRSHPLHPGCLFQPEASSLAQARSAGLYHPIFCMVSVDLFWPGQGFSKLFFGASPSGFSSVCSDLDPRGYRKPDSREAVQSGSDRIVDSPNHRHLFPSAITAELTRHPWPPASISVVLGN